MFFRKFELMVEQVYGDEGVGSRKLGSEDGPESDSSNPDDAHRLTDPYLGVVVDDAEPVVIVSAKGLPRDRVWVNRRQSTFGNDGISLKVVICGIYRRAVPPVSRAGP